MIKHAYLLSLISCILFVQCSLDPIDPTAKTNPENSKTVERNLGEFSFNQITPIRGGIHFQLNVASTDAISDFYYACYEDVIAHEILCDGHLDSIVFTYRYQKEQIKQNVITSNKEGCKADSMSLVIKRYAIDSLNASDRNFFNGSVFRLYEMIVNKTEQDLSLPESNYDFYYLLFSTLDDIKTKKDRSCSFSMIKGLEYMFDEELSASPTCNNLIQMLVSYAGDMAYVQPQHWPSECSK